MLSERLDDLDAPPKDMRVEHPSGVRTTIRYFENRGPDKKKTKPTEKGLLARFSLPEAPENIYRLTPKRRLYTEKHLVLSHPALPQRLADVNQIRLGFRFLKGMGPAYSGFFNTAAGSVRRFHFQIFGMPLPLWENLEAEYVTVVNRQLDGAVSRGTIQGWPFRAPIYESGDLEALAERVSAAIEEQQQERPAKDTDLLFTLEEDGTFKAVLVERYVAKIKPKSFYPEQPNAYGNFGDLELSGLLLVKDGKVFEMLETNPRLAAERIEAALRETTS